MAASSGAMVAGLAAVGLEAEGQEIVGAVGEIPADEVIVGVDPDPANKDKITKWARDYWDAVHPFSAPGAYVNFMMEEGAARVEATYGGNYAKLRDVKAKYDPGNVFRFNQNIDPAPVVSRGTSQLSAR